MILLIYGLYLILPIISTPIIIAVLILKKNQYKFIIPLLCINMSIIAFNTKPLVTDDLTSYFSLLRNMKNFGLYFVNNISEFRQFPTINYFFYMISLTNNFHLLPAITIFFVYFVYLYIIFNYSNKEYMNKFSIFIGVLFLLSIVPIYEIISGIRSQFGCAILIIAIYRDIIKKKRNFITIFLYVLAFFTHSSITILIFLRLIIVVYKKFSKVVLGLIIIFWPLYINLINSMLNLFSGIPIFNIVNKKLFEYTGTGKGELNWSIDILIFRLSICILIMLCTIILQKYKKKSINMFIDFIQIVICFTIGAILFSYVHIAIRFTSFIFTIAPIIIINTINVLNNKYKLFLASIFIILSLAGIYYQFLTLSHVDIGSERILIENIFECFK